MGENHDKILYKDFLKGNNAAFEELVLKYKDHLIYFLQRFIKDISACEDIAQDVFAYIFTFKDKYNDKFEVKTYVYMLAKNKAVDYIRKQSKQVPISEISDNELSTDKDELFNKVIQDENIRLVHECLAKLNSDYQTAIHLVDFEELSYKNASIVMSKTVPQFKVLIFRARKTLKLLLEKGGYTIEK